MPSFNDFSLQPTTRTTLTNMQITEPTPIQAEAIPVLLAGKDLVGRSATGSGKTLAYGIPLIERVARNTRSVQALVMVPTRELAVQVNTVLNKFAGSRRLTTALLVGGRPYGTQISALRYGAQIVVGTPGRIKDHLDRGTLVLTQLRICVLDEADQMLDIGFAPIIEEILTTTPETRQMALFSATMPEWIVKLQQKFLKEPVNVDIALVAGAESTIEQIAYQIPHDQKMAALCTLLNSAEGKSSLIFGKTKFGVEKLGKQLSGLGFTVGTLHGNKSQRARDEVLTAFRQGHIQTLLATNVAARGLDITGIYQVINYELPESSDLFTHRIGRTGRMGRQGKAITLLVPSDLPKWRRMARNLGQAVTLQRLVIDREALAPLPVATPDFSVMPDRDEDQRPVRGRRSFGSDRDRDEEQRSGRGRRSFGSDRDRDEEQRSGRGRRSFGPDYERGEQEAPRERQPLVTERVQSEEQRSMRGRRPFVPDRDPNGEQVPVRARRQFVPDREIGDEQWSDDGRKQFVPDSEQNYEQRPRGRKPAASDQGRERSPRPERDNAGDRRPRRENESSPARSSEGFNSSDRPSRDGRRVAGRSSSFGRTSGRNKFAATEPQYQAGRRKPGAASTQTRRETPTKRSVIR